jgi:hypothetical protein
VFIAYICSLPPHTGAMGSCGSFTQSQTRYYFNVATQHCIPFVFSGCDGNLNSFSTVVECNDFCMSAGDRLNYVVIMIDGIFFRMQIWWCSIYQSEYAQTACMQHSIVKYVSAKLRLYIRCTIGSTHLLRCIWYGFVDLFDNYYYL